MIPQVVTVGPFLAASANFYVTSVTPTSGTALTLAHNTADVARPISLAYGNEASQRTLVLTGTDRNGNTITETLTVPAGGAGSPIATQQDFLTLTSALPQGGGWTAAITLGTNGVVDSPWQVVDYHLTPMNLAIAAVLTGTINVTIQYTYDDLNKPTLGGNQGFLSNKIPTVFNHATLVNLAATQDGFINDPIWAWRVRVNSGGQTPANVVATGIQSGLMQGGA